MKGAGLIPAAVCVRVPACAHVFKSTHLKEIFKMCFNEMFLENVILCQSKRIKRYIYVEHHTTIILLLITILILDFICLKKHTTYSHYFYIHCLKRISI